MQTFKTGLAYYFFFLGAAGLLNSKHMVVALLKKVFRSSQSCHFMKLGVLWNTLGTIAAILHAWFVRLRLLV